ncbi:hypothetical protein, partial [Gynuella sp.]|uniref:hypothetical protein n=1 Tax=Gynuella sp. TaxID=2969146 RepID=UPI003D0FDE5D
PIERPSHYNSQIQLALDSLLTSDMDATGLQLYWREAGSGLSFEHQIALTADADGNYQYSLDELPYLNTKPPLKERVQNSIPAQHPRTM